MKSVFSLENKNIWILGGAGYLGQAVTKLIFAMEAQILCLNLGDRAHDFVRSSNFEGKVVGDTLDVSDLYVIDSQIDLLIKKYGVPDGLVNLTFGSTASKFEDLTYVDFDKANQLNLTSTFAISRKIGEAMIAKGKRGSHVLFSSMYGMGSPYPEAYEPNLIKNPIEYGVGKAGVIQMTKYLAVHWGKQGIRCNSVSPGPFPNPQVQKNHPDFIQKLSEKSPMGRIGMGEEIAGAVAFLLSDGASYVNGHNLVVDGAWTAW